MEKTFNQILKYADLLEKQSLGLTCEIQIDYLKNKIAKDSEVIKFRTGRINARVKRKKNYELSEQQTLLYFLAGIEILWTRPAKISEILLHGGFAFNGLTDVLTMKTDFWVDSIKEFGKNPSSEELKFLNTLSWFESPTPHALAIYTPMYGCFELLENKYPERLFFYDSGTVYELDMTFEAYISNLIDSVAVYCWQYFYIDPDVIIRKNKGIKGTAWYMSMEIDFPEQNDRLENIIMYMEYCVKLLPTSFPGKDFTFHQNSLDKLKSKL